MRVIQKANPATPSPWPSTVISPASEHSTPPGPAKTKAAQSRSPEPPFYALERERLDTVAAVISGLRAHHIGITDAIAEELLRYAVAEAIVDKAGAAFFRYAVDVFLWVANELGIADAIGKHDLGKAIETIAGKDFAGSTFPRGWFAVD